MAEREEIILRRRTSLTKWDRFTDFVRSFTLGPFNPRDPAIARMFGSTTVHAGVSVSEHTAMNLSAVWAAVNLISSDVASVPLKLYRREKGGKSPMENHPVYRLIHDQPNPQMSAFVFRRCLQAHKLVWGNGYAEIERDASGRPANLWPLLPYAVEPYLERGILRYRHWNPDGSTIEFPAADIVHIRGYTLDGICAASQIAKARESLGLTVAAERFGATFFGNGATFGGVISYPPGIGNNAQTRKENREAIEKAHQGPDRAHRFLALYEGAKYERLGIPPDDAQFLETRKFQIEEVARWYNLAPYKLRRTEGSASYASIEQQSIEYVTDTLDPHWVDWEQELRIKLIAPLERTQQTIEHQREGRLRGDAASRGEFHSKLFSVGSITQNEIRKNENLNELPDDLGGNVPYVPFNMVPADLARDYWQAQIDKFNREAQPPPPPPPPPPGPTQEELKAARKVAQEAEDARDVALEMARRAEEAKELITAAHAITAEQAERDRIAAADKLEHAIQSIRDAVKREQVAIVERDGFAIERDTARAQAGQIATERDTIQAAYDAMGIANTEALEVLQGLRRTAEVDRDAALALATQAEKERDAEKTRAAEADAAAALAVADAVAARADCAVAVSTRDVAVAAVGTLTFDAEALKTELARARADIAAELDKQRTHKATMLAAMRSLFVEATDRLLTKESNAARKHQLTPEKLRDWIERFYPLHADTVREVLRPLVGPWTALTDGAPGLLLERLVSEHIGASETALRHVVDADDPDAMAATLERTLRRWEDERAETMADALVREGMAS
jgi:HK97 family phage portal protein